MKSKNQDAFQLKAHFFPMTVIKFTSCDKRSVVKQLKQIKQIAPHYFRQSPAVIDVAELSRPAKGLDLAKLSTLLRDYQLIPVGVQGLSTEEEILAQELDIALWQPMSKCEPEKKTSQVEETTATVQVKRKPNKIVTKPVRSGMRIYAPGGNLVLLAPVSSGAECIADGDIFAYSPVRGRLLAGASGDEQAQIFCSDLQAELIAIAGYYLIYEEYAGERTGHFQIVLKESKIQISCC